MFMNDNSQALIDVLAGVDAGFMAALEQQQADKLTAQERGVPCDLTARHQHPRLPDLGHR
jgi:hypothetical protein